MNLYGGGVHQTVNCLVLELSGCVNFDKTLFAVISFMDLE